MGTLVFIIAMASASQGAQVVQGTAPGAVSVTSTLKVLSYSHSNVKNNGSFAMKGVRASFILNKVTHHVMCYGRGLEWLCSLDNVYHITKGNTQNKTLKEFYHLMVRKGSTR